MDEPAGMDERTSQTLADLLEFAAMGERIVARGRERYDRDELLRLAAEAVFIRIGEAVARLGDAFTAAHPTVRWRRMRGLRNLVAHEYGAIDHGALWRTLERELPQDARAIAELLAANR